jgi:hypothetical protein
MVFSRHSLQDPVVCTRGPGVRNLGTLFSFCLVDTTVFVQQHSSKNSVFIADIASRTYIKQIIEEEDTPSSRL